MTEAYKLRLGDLESISFSDLLLKPGKIVELLIDGHWMKLPQFSGQNPLKWDRSPL